MRRRPSAACGASPNPSQEIEIVFGIQLLAEIGAAGAHATREATFELPPAWSSRVFETVP